MYETPVHTVQPTFARGEVSPNLFGRVDTTAYSAGLRTLRNGIVRPEGAVSNRQGFQFIGNSLTNTSLASKLIPFIFSATQSYVIEVQAGVNPNSGIAQVFSNGALVTGATFVVPWAAADLPLLRWSQSTDTLTVCHSKYPTVEIKRTSANSFTITTAAYQLGPFLPQNTDGTTTISASGVIGSVTLTANAPIFNANQVGGLLQLTEQDFSQVPPWEPEKVFGSGQSAAVGQVRRSNLKNYIAGLGVNTGTGTLASGTVAPSHSQGTQADGDGQSAPGVAASNGILWTYQDSETGIVLITGFTDSMHVTGTVQPNYVGGPARLPTSVATGGGGAGNTTYWAFGAFSADQGYAGACSYFPDRLVLAATTNQPVGVFGSQTSQYHNFGVSNPVVASDAFTVFLNARQLNAISDLIPLSDLLVGTSNINWRLWPGSTGTALSPLAIAATPQSYYGQSPTCASVLFGDSAIFAEYDGRRLRDLIYQFAYDKFLGQELTLYSRHLIPYGTQLVRLAYKPDPAGQMVLALRSDGVLLHCCYLRDQQVIGWSHFDTAGTFEDICVVPESSSFALYVITRRLVNGSFVRYVERWTSREVTTLYDYKFLDCCLTYDGRNTSSTVMTLSGGSSWLANDTGTITANSSAGWTGFVSTDPTNNNEIWLYGTLTFTGGIGSMQIGTLTAPVVPGQYILTFAKGAQRTVTVAPDGKSCTWVGPLPSGNITTATYRCRLLLTGYTSATVCSVRLRDPCPVGLQSVPTVNWTFARTYFTGATQIAGGPAVALVDSTVVGMTDTGIAPNGSLTVSNLGTFSLQVAGGVVQIGIPYLFDFETLSLNLQGQETIRMRAKSNPVIYLDVTETRNFLAGTDFTTISPAIERSTEAYNSPVDMQSGAQWSRVESTLDSECHTCIRQNMPLPITIRMHIPQVTIGEPIS